MLWVLRVEHLVQRQFRIHAIAVNRQARAFLGKLLVVLAQIQFAAQRAHQVFGIALVVDREPRVNADRFAVLPQQARSGPVERASPDAAVHVGIAQHGGHAFDHLRGGTASEREQQNPFRRHALRDQPGDAIHQRRRLAGAGAGDDQQRFQAVAGRLALRVVQPGQQAVGFRFRPWRGRQAGIRRWLDLLLPAAGSPIPGRRFGSGECFGRGQLDGHALQGDGIGFDHRQGFRLRQSSRHRFRFVGRSRCPAESAAGLW